jgi:hypothetical protein
VLIVLGAVLLFVGSIAYYARTEVIDQKSFADRALVALEDDGLRKVVRREIVVNLIDRGSSDLIAARPLLESVVDVVLQSAPFRKVFRQAAVQANRVFFVRDKKNALFDISDSAELVRFALRSVSPNLAKDVPKDLDATLLTLRRRARRLPRPTPYGCWASCSLCWHWRPSRVASPWPPTAASACCAPAWRWEPRAPSWPLPCWSCVPASSRG